MSRILSGISPSVQSAPSSPDVFPAVWINPPASVSSDVLRYRVLPADLGDSTSDRHIVVDASQPEWSLEYRVAVHPSFDSAVAHAALLDAAWHGIGAGSPEPEPTAEDREWNAAQNADWHAIDSLDSPLYDDLDCCLDYDPNGDDLDSLDEMDAFFRARPADHPDDSDQPWYAFERGRGWQQHV